MAASSTFKDLMDSLLNNNKKTAERDIEQTKLMKESKEIQKDMLDALKSIKDAIKSMSGQTVAKQPAAVVTKEENDSVANESASDLRVISENTGALLLMSRDISVIRQNIQQMLKSMGVEAKTDADKMLWRSEGVLKEFAGNRAKEAEAKMAKTAEGDKPAQAATTEPKTGFLGKLKGFGKDMSGWAKNLLALSAALFITAKAFQQFAKVSWDGVIKGTAAMFALAAAAKMAGSGDAYKSILALGVGTLALAYGMSKFGDVSWESIGKGIVAMTALGLAAKLAGSGDAYKSILALGAGTVILAFGLEKFGDVTWENVGMGVTTLLALGFAARIAGSGDAYKSILALGVGVIALAYGLDKFADVSWDEIATGAIALTALAGAARLAGSGDASKSILALGISTLALAFGLNMFADVSWESVAKGTTVMLVLGAASAMAGKEWKSIAALAVSMLALSFAFEKFAAISWTDFGKGVVAMIALVVAGNMASGSLAGGVALLLLSAAVWVMADAFQKFAEISWGDVLKGIVAIGVLAVGAALLAPLAIPIGITAVALIALGGAMLILGAGISAISESLPSITAGIKELADLDGMNLLQVAAGIGAIALALLAFGAAQMGAALTNLITNFLSFGQDSPIDQIRELSEIDGDALERVGDGLWTIADALNMMASIDSSNLEDVMDALDDFPWLRATALALAGGSFNVTTKNATMSGGAVSKASPVSGMIAPATAAPGTAGQANNKTVPLTKAPMTTEALFIANEPVTKDRPLSRIQRAVMKQQIASGKSSYPDWVMQKYKSEGDELASKSSDLDAAKREPAAAAPSQSIVNAPVTNVSQTNQTPGAKDPRNYQPSYNNYLNRRLAN